MVRVAVARKHLPGRRDGGGRSVVLLAVYIGYKFRFLLISRDRICQWLSDLMFKVKYCAAANIGDATTAPSSVGEPRFEKFNYPPAPHTHSFIHSAAMSEDETATASSGLLNGKIM